MNLYTVLEEVKDKICEKCPYLDNFDCTLDINITPYQPKCIKHDKYVKASKMIEELAIKLDEYIAK